MSASQFRMMAADSVTGLVYYWSHSGGDADWSASGYPGPFAAIDVAVVGSKPGEVSDPIPDASGLYEASITLQGAQTTASVPAGGGTYSRTITANGTTWDLDVEFFITVVTGTGRWELRYRVITVGVLQDGTDAAVQTEQSIVAWDDLTSPACPEVVPSVAVDGPTGDLTLTVTNNDGSTAVGLVVGYNLIQSDSSPLTTGPILTFTPSPPTTGQNNVTGTTTYTDYPATGGNGSGATFTFTAADNQAFPPLNNISGFSMTSGGDGFAVGDIIRCTYPGTTGDAYFDLTVDSVDAP